VRQAGKGSSGPYAYITNSGNGYENGSVSVIDTSTNDVIATVDVGKGPNGVTLNPARTRVYVGNDYESTVSVIDTSTNTVIDIVEVGRKNCTDISGLAVNPSGTKVYVANPCSNTVSVIDTSTDTGDCQVFS
jgi:YVTN family beta-propeller protein